MASGFATWMSVYLETGRLFESCDVRWGPDLTWKDEEILDFILFPTLYPRGMGGISQFEQQHVNMQVHQGKSVTSLCNKELLHIPILNLRGICRITQGRSRFLMCSRVQYVVGHLLNLEWLQHTPHMTIDVLCLPLVTLLTSSLHSCGRTPLLFRDSDETHAPKCVGQGIRCCWNFNVFRHYFLVCAP